MSIDPLDSDVPVEQSDDLVRVKRAYTIACLNLADLNDHSQRLTAALDGALMLIDNLLKEMRSANVRPSPAIVSFKAGFDQGMRELLGKSREESTSP